MSFRVIATTPKTALKFRNKLANNCPTWLNGPWGARYVYPMGLLLDCFADAGIFAVKARFPDTAPEDALSFLAQDRQIDRGFQEPRGSYNDRLKAWLDLWRKAGSAGSVMAALGSYIFPEQARMRTVNNASAWDTTEAGETVPVHFLADPKNWDWDSYVFSKNTPDIDDVEYQAKWYRAWVIIYPPASLWVKDQEYGDGHTYGDGRVYGFSGTVDQARTIRQQVKKWKPAHVIVVNVILAFDPDTFDPESAYPNAGVLPGGEFRWYGLRVGDLYTPYRGIIGTGGDTFTASFIAGTDLPRYGPD